MEALPPHHPHQVAQVDPLALRSHRVLVLREERLALLELVSKHPLNLPRREGPAARVIADSDLAEPVGGGERQERPRRAFGQLFAALAERFFGDRAEEFTRVALKNLRGRAHARDRQKLADAPAVQRVAVPLADAVDQLHLQG